VSNTIYGKTLTIDKYFQWGLVSFPLIDFRDQKGWIAKNGWKRCRILAVQGVGDRHGRSIWT
jgi:hypothetical protein